MLDALLSPLQVFPVFEAFWISFGVVSGLVYYDTEETSFTSELKQVSTLPTVLIADRRCRRLE